MPVSARRVAAAAAMSALAFAAIACSPRAQAPVQVASTAASPATTTGSSGLPASCQTLLASMQSCSDNLTRSGSPLGAQIRASMTDMRNSIAGAPPAETASFCDTEAAAFAQRAQASHC